MSNVANTWTLVSSFFVHVIFLISIFDIYFKSPITIGIEPVENNVPPLAKRLILFVGDGLRADSFFELQSTESSSFYLRYIIENRGRWGLSHSAVPTESRPGHVALIAGFYEDPSAIFKGWKNNPVEFDSVFNQSTMTFGWGSPDILLMFINESNKKKMFMNPYSSASQEFSGVSGSAARLSLWTFENFQLLLQDAKSNHSLFEMLNQNKIVFFFHLLGIDTAGHSYKPHSEVYKENIRIADKIVKDTEKLIAEFYNHDDQSVFIFTSDHGMTDWGSHGEGSARETEVPFVAWGSGIQKPTTVHKVHSPTNWNVNHLERTDINQIDTAPLMSVLLGIPIPVNSVGTLPVSILKYSVAEESSALLLNAQQMLAQFIQKRNKIEETTLKFLYKPFDQLSDGKDSEILQRLKSQFRNGHYNVVIDGSRQLILLCSAGLSYYHNYYQKLLLICISCSYIGWICWLLLSILASDAPASTEHNKLWRKKKHPLFLLNCTFIVLILISLVLLIVQFLPYQYYLYCCLPTIICWNVLRKLIVSRLKFTLSYSHLFALFATVVGTELVVISFFERRTLSVVMFFLMFWPLSYVMKKTSRTIFFLLWILSCSSLMIFPFLPVIGGKPKNVFVILSAVLWWILIILSWKFLSRMHSAYAHSKSISCFHIFSFLFGIVLTNILHVDLTFSVGGLSFLNQFVSWSMLLLIPLLPLVSSRKLVLRLQNIYFSFGIVSLLFSVNHDALFLPLFSFHLFLWFLAENIIVSDQNNHLVFDFPCTKFSKLKVSEKACLKSSDLRRAFLFFFYTVLSFFGIGNIASINSFDTTWVRCFLTVFAPFTMMTLILIKIIIPFIVTACTFRAVNEVTKVAVDKIFFLVLIYCDIMGLNFLFLVKNVGSWLEIGSSVSHYVISQTIILFLVFLYVLSSYLTSFKLKKTKGILLKFNQAPVKHA